MSTLLQPIRIRFRSKQSGNRKDSTRLIFVHVYLLPLGDVLKVLLQVFEYFVQFSSYIYKEPKAFCQPINSLIHNSFDILYIIIRTCQNEKTFLRIRHESIAHFRSHQRHSGFINDSLYTPQQYYFTSFLNLQLNKILRRSTYNVAKYNSRALIHI